jgi:hypothetical protein
MELIKIKLNRASKVFDLPLATFLDLFGFAKNAREGYTKIESGKVTVNKQPIPIEYVLRPGDLVEYCDCGIIIEEE